MEPIQSLSQAQTSLLTNARYANKLWDLFFFSLVGQWLEPNGHTPFSNVIRRVPKRGFFSSFPLNSWFLQILLFVEGRPRTFPPPCFIENAASARLFVERDSFSR